MHLIDVAEFGKGFGLVSKAQGILLAASESVLADVPGLQVTAVNVGDVVGHNSA